MGDLRIGMIGLDTSHVIVFTRTFNDPKSPDHVPGGKVVAAFKVPTTMGFASRCAYLFKDGKCVYADHKGHTGDQAQVILEFLKGAKK